MPRAKLLAVSGVQYCVGYSAAVAIWAVATSNYFRASFLFGFGLVSLVPFLLGLARTTSANPPGWVHTAVAGATVALVFIVFPYLLHQIWPNPPDLSPEDFYTRISLLLLLVAGPLAAGWVLSRRVAHSNRLLHPDSRDVAAGEQKR